jgi:hypothetical protein
VTDLKAPGPPRTWRSEWSVYLQGAAGGAAGALAVIAWEHGLWTEVAAEWAAALASAAVACIAVAVPLRDARRRDAEKHAERLSLRRAAEDAVSETIRLSLNIRTVMADANFKVQVLEPWITAIRQELARQQLLYAQSIRDPALARIVHRCAQLLQRMENDIRLMSVLAGQGMQPDRATPTLVIDALVGQIRDAMEALGLTPPVFPPGFESTYVAPARPAPAPEAAPA